MYAKYGPDYYRKIGSKGGKNGTTGGFYANRELASRVGAIGGKVSRRRKASMLKSEA
jgi:general stress protein YciG